MPYVRPLREIGVWCHDSLNRAIESIDAEDLPLESSCPGFFRRSSQADRFNIDSNRVAEQKPLLKLSNTQMLDTK